MQVPQHAALVATTRGERAECVHYGSFAVVDSTGKLLAGAGEPDALNFPRSALKPLQALPFVEDGGMARWGFDSRHLAMMCASHGGEPVHVGLVAGMLQRIGARVEDLGCGCHAPSFFSTTGAAPPRRARWSSLHHNCSGKHSGFLAWCRMQGQPMQNYLDAQAPLQERIRKIVQRFAGSHPIAMGIDGCSAPNYALPLSALARSYCSLALGDGDALAAISLIVVSLVSTGWIAGWTYGV